MKHADIEAFYQTAYNEEGRMERNPLEFIRCKEIISRYLYGEPMEIADIGGAAGVFSYWLAAQGHRMHLLDFTPLHIEQAKKKGKTLGITLASYHCADARSLPFAHGSLDMALLMGPLYHLQDKTNRLQCLSEAMRVLKPGGILLCEAISRYASLVDGFKQSEIEDPKLVEIVDRDLATGRHDPGDTAYFTTAFLHTPGELEAEVALAGFKNIELIAVEGFANAMDSHAILKNKKQRELLLEYIRRTEGVPELMGISGHFIAIASTPSVARGDNSPKGEPGGRNVAAR